MRSVAGRMKLAVGKRPHGVLRESRRAFPVREVLAVGKFRQPADERLVQFVQKLGLQIADELRPVGQRDEQAAVRLLVMAEHQLRGALHEGHGADQVVAELHGPGHDGFSPGDRVSLGIDPTLARVIAG